MKKIVFITCRMRAAALALLLAATAAQLAEHGGVPDGTTFMLAAGRRCLATTHEGSTMQLVGGCEARLANEGAGGWRVTWTSVRAPGGRIYLRSGDVLLRALDDETLASPVETPDLSRVRARRPGETAEERVARSAQVSTIG